MPADNLMSPLSAHEITTLLGNIRDTAASLGAPEVGRTALQATVSGIRKWCGDAELTIAMLAFTGLQQQPAVPSTTN